MNTAIETAGARRSELLTVEQAADHLNIQRSTLDSWRSTRRVAIPFIRIGGAIRYRRSDLDAFISSNAVAA